VDEEISIGDYVLSGGELAALVIVDAWRRSCREWSATSSRWRRTRSAGGCSIFRITRGRPTGDPRGRRKPRLKVPDVLLVGQPRGDPALAEARSRSRGRSRGGPICCGRRAGRRGTGDLRELVAERQKL
jgi:tRNA G37 N-methylase TrmD